MDNLKAQVEMTGQVHADLLKQLEEAKKLFLEVRGSGKYFWPNLIKWWEFNRVIKSWKNAWDYHPDDLKIIAETLHIECMVEPVNEMNDLLVNYKDDMVGVMSYTYGKDVATEFFNIYSFGGRI